MARAPRFVREDTHDIVEDGFSAECRVVDNQCPVVLIDKEGGQTGLRRSNPSQNEVLRITRARASHAAARLRLDTSGMRAAVGIAA